MDCVDQPEENGEKFVGMMLGGCFVVTKLGKHLSTADDNSYCVGPSAVDTYQVSLQFLV